MPKRSPYIIPHDTQRSCDNELFQIPRGTIAYLSLEVESEAATIYALCKETKIDSKKVIELQKKGFAVLGGPADAMTRKELAALQPKSASVLTPQQKAALTREANKAKKESAEAEAPAPEERPEVEPTGQSE